MGFFVIIKKNKNDYYRKRLRTTAAALKLEKFGFKAPKISYPNRQVLKRFKARKFGKYGYSKN
jgi:hypothetical protein